MLDVLADLPRPAVRSDLLLAEEHADHVVVGADEHGLAREAPWHAVAIAIEGDAKRLGHRTGLDVVDVERRVGDRFEPALLLVAEHQRRNLAGLLVAPIVGEVVAPPHRLGVEVDEVGEPTAAPEPRAHETDAALDATLLVTLAGIAGDDGEPARLGVLDESAVEHGRVRL